MMLRQIERPFDFLNSLKGKNVKITFRAYKTEEITGVLMAFDIHLNLVIDAFEGGKRNQRFVKGEGVLFIEEHI